MSPAPDEPPPAIDELASEVSSLDEARRHLLQGDSVGALAAIDRYRATWPNGRLGLEAAVLRIEALVRAGQNAEARALANALLTAHPSTPFAHRVRALVGFDEASHGIQR